VAENSNRARMAEVISKDVFGFFRWNTIFVKDRDFPCRKEGDHKKTDKPQAHTHPVDVVFYYFDSYTGNYVYLNTDLKSYAQKSISMTQVRKALQSLRDTVDCAKSSPEWKQKYIELEGAKADIRGMLFVYNHDGGFDKDFNRFFERGSGRGHISLEGLKLKRGNYLHLFTPDKISYLTTILNDIKNLRGDNKFPKNNYSFYYPELRLHREHEVDPKKRCATIEMLCSSFFLIEHGSVKKRKKSGEKKVIHDKGVIVYYNETGSTKEEFIYLLDILSNYQLLKSDVNLQIRFAHSEKDQNLISNFKKAKKSYIHAWGFDPEKEKQLDRINLQLVERYKDCFSEQKINWDDE
jgi:hypothetical protein